VSWVESNLGESCELYQPKTITTKDLTPDGKYLVYGANGVIGRYDKFNHEEPQLLITCRGATCGSVNISSPFSWINGNAMVVKPKHREISIRYLEYFFRGAVDLSKAITGAAQPQITRQSLSPIGFKYPSLSTQQKIVSKLDAIFAEVDKATAATEANTKNAEALFDSSLRYLFNGDRSGWSENVKPLSELCELIVDFEHKTAPTQNEGYPSIRTPNVGKGKLMLNDVYRVSEETYAEWTRRAQPRAGDLILAREAPAGNVAVIPENIKVCLGQRTVLIRPNLSVFMSTFLAYMLLQPNIRAKLLAHSRGATVQHVNMKDIRALNVGSIPPLSVQKEIISNVDKIINQAEILQVRYREKLFALNKLKNSILQQAFNGELVKD
jgi:type I restriction enzyme S subunit